MSFALPGPQAPPMRQRVVPESQRQTQENDLQHRRQVLELQQIAAKQTKRIEDLKLNTALQLEHHSTLRRMELERRKSDAQEAMASLAPRLEVVRNQWNYAKQQNQGYEMQWGSMRSQFQQVKHRLDALKDQITDGRSTIESTRRTLNEMREHLHRLERDKAAMRGKIKRALECLVIDDNFLQSRLQEEEQYHTQMQQALVSMETEYRDSQAQHQHEFAPLEQDVRLLCQFLEEMQARTKELQRYCLELESKGSTIEDQWLESVHTVFESVERAKQLDQLKSTVVKFLEQQILECRQQNIQPRGRAGNMDAYWLTNAARVWEGIVHEVSKERQKLAIRDEEAQLAAEISQRAQQAKAQLNSVKNKVFGGVSGANSSGAGASSSAVAVAGGGNQRRQLFLDIGDMHYVLMEKKEAEEQMIKFVQEVATQLDEDISLVLHVVRKDGFDDYVSSTDDEGGSSVGAAAAARGDQTDGDAAAEFAALREETVDDISHICSSLDLDPDDPSSSDALRRMAHRPEGPLREFAARRAQFLQRAAAEKRFVGGGSDARRRAGAGTATSRAHIETLESALMGVQLKVSDDVITYVRNRQLAIQEGQLDPKQERLQPDPRFAPRARELNNRMERWIQQHKDAPTSALVVKPPTASDRNRAVLAGSAAAAGSSGSAPLLRGDGASAGEQRIVIDGARLPPDVARGNPIAKATYFTTHAVRGFNFLMYLRRTMGAQLRHVFVSRDLTRIVARRVGGNATRGAAGDEDIVMRLADVSNIVLGHKTDVFKEVRAASGRQPMRDELAFSVISHLGTTFDIECESVDDRGFWAQNFAWVINEARSGGILHTLTRSGKFSVVDSLNRTPTTVEPTDRSVLQIQVMN